MMFCDRVCYDMSRERTLWRGRSASRTRHWVDTSTVPCVGPVDTPDRTIAIVVQVRSALVLVSINQWSEISDGRGVACPSTHLCCVTRSHLDLAFLLSLCVCVCVCVCVWFSGTLLLAGLLAASTVATLAVSDQYVIISGRCDCLVSDSKQTTIRLSHASSPSSQTLCSCYGVRDIVRDVTKWI